jgi:hypothetical protein
VQAEIDPPAPAHTPSGWYLSACPQPWRDVATIILDEGFRPSEVFSLRWEHTAFQGRGFIRLTDAKSKAGRRTLPMTSRVYELLRERHLAQRELREGWAFPSTSQIGHFDANAAKDQHKRALNGFLHCSMWPAWNSSDQFIAIQPSSMDIFTDLAQYPIHCEELKRFFAGPPDFPLGIC